MKSMKTSGSMFKDIALGYARLAGSVGLFLAAVAATVAAAAAIVWPLWALAVNRTGVYNLVFVSAICLCAVLGAAFSVRRKLAAGATPGALARKALAVAGLVLAWAALAASLYLAVAFIARGSVALAGAAILAFVALAGLLYSRRKRA